MKDRPMLFGAPMVCALLDGRKSQTRRVWKPRGFEFYTHPISGDRYDQYRPYRDGTWDKSRIIGSGPMRGFGWGEELYGYLAYEPGDRLWVKEAWKPGSWRDDGRVAVDYRASPELVRTPWCAPENFDELWPKWTDELTAIGSVPDEAGIHHWEAGKSPLKWRSSMFMPRWASRLTLTVTDVRVERLQAISEADAIAEGIYQVRTPDQDGMRHFGTSRVDSVWPTAARAYRNLWNNLHGPGAWKANPWVTAITFTVAHSNIDQVPA